MSDAVGNDVEPRVGDNEQNGASMEEDDAIVGADDATAEEACREA